MAYLVSELLETLSSILLHERNQEVRFVVGVKKEVDHLTRQLRSVKLELADAEVRKLKDRRVEDWLECLYRICYDLDDVLDRWSTSILKSEFETAVAVPSKPNKRKPKVFSSCFPCGQAGLLPDIASKIKDINKRLDGIVGDKALFNLEFKKSIEEHVIASFVDETVYGRDVYKKKIIDYLRIQTPLPDVVCIVGMGGVGKTTLAEQVYNDESIQAEFDEKLWLWDSGDFNDFRTRNEVSEVFFPSDLAESRNHHQSLSLLVRGKKFLLVLDDVWNEDAEKWDDLYDSLKRGMPGSKILVTTRSHWTAEVMGSDRIISLDPLTDEEAWSLFKHYAFSGKDRGEVEGLVEIGMHIAKRCRGLPLFVRTMGAFLRFKNREEWERMVYVMGDRGWDTDAILRALLLCSHDLPSRMRHCFSYCALFPKNYLFDPDKLISLWMAQGYIRPTPSKDMVMIGGEYFQNLAARTFFQNFTKDENGSIITCQMHDLLHDLAMSLRRGECRYDYDDRAIEFSQERLRHSMVKVSQNGRFPVFSSDVLEKLRSLMVEFDGHRSETILHDIFSQLTCLRALKLSNFSDTEIAGEIGKLIQLRQLDLSNSKYLVRLPEEISELYNLQTLDVSGCEKLERLPDGVCRLINLMFLKNYKTKKLTFMPRGIERLNGLRTLEEFVVKGGDHNVKASTLGDLKDLNQLQKYLMIRGLGNLRDVGEAKNAQLMEKKRLTTLILSFDFQETESERGMVQDHEVIKVLEPPPGLEHLVINCFRDTTVFSNWMLRLAELSKVCLSDFMKCNQLPPLGKLPSLKYLEISLIQGVRKVGYEFLGIESDGMAKEDEGQASTSSSSSIVAFPKLKELKFSSMEAWEEWDARITSEVTIMPCLLRLYIRDCPKLEALPTELLLQMTSLQELAIYDCSVLNTNIIGRGGKDCDGIAHIPIIKFDDELRLNEKGKQKLHTSAGGAENRKTHRS